MEGLESSGEVSERKNREGGERENDSSTDHGGETSVEQQTHSDYMHSVGDGTNITSSGVGATVVCSRSFNSSIIISFLIRIISFFVYYRRLGLRLRYVNPKLTRKWFKLTYANIFVLFYVR